MNPDKITFSIEKSCGEDRPAIHLYFGSGVRIKVGNSLESLHYLILRLGTIAEEIREHQANELGE